MQAVLNNSVKKVFFPLVIISLFLAGCIGLDFPAEEEERVSDNSGKSGLKENAVVLFIGDSITDGGRNYNDLSSLGNNSPPRLFLNTMRSRFPGENITVYNTGIAGDQAIELYLRLEEDCYNLNPDYILLQIGVNDSWNGYEGRAAFEKIYREIILGIKTNTHAELIISEPYLLEATEGMQKACSIPNVNSYLRKVREMRDVVRALTAEYGVKIIYLDEIFRQEIAKGMPPAKISSDAIHPSVTGTGIMMEQIFRKLNIPGPGNVYGPYDVSSVEKALSKTNTGPQEPELFAPVPEGTGFCAVGNIDQQTNTARILLETGEVVDAPYAPAPNGGNVLKSGSVYSYRLENGVYTFSEPVWTSSRNTPVLANNRNKRLYREKSYFTDKDTVFFVRYSDTEWRVFKGRSAMPCKTYLVDLVETHGSMMGVKVMDTPYMLARCVMVTGGPLNNGLWPPAKAETTKFLDPSGAGFSSGDIVL
jgi:lysophospholipase L1-like esterase